MSAHAPSLHDELEAALKASRGDVTFRLFLAQRRVPDDALLADLIALDASYRMSNALPVQLQDYLDAVPDLAVRAEPLDAAIDSTLQSLAASGLSPLAAAQTLMGNYPGLERPIRDALALSGAIGATTLIRKAVASRRSRVLPCDFGAATPDGAPRFQLRALLGRGAHGDVFLAHDRLLSDAGEEALVAVKVFPRRLDGWWAEQRFAEEATKAHRIRHDNVVRVLDRGRTDDGEEYIVYELVSGGTLEKARAGASPPTPRAAALLALKVARAVQAAHAAGVYHCDLKPSNILIDDAGEPRVADFGVAVRASDEFNAPDERPEKPIGTLAFMAPEQYRMEDGSLSAPADIYALGAILFWLLTGENPNGRTAAEVARALAGPHPRAEAPSPRALRAGVDADLDAIVRRALAPLPADRHPAAASLADDLEAWLQRRPIAWRRPSIVRTAALWARRRPAVASLTALVLVVSVSAGWVAWSLAERARIKQAQAAAFNEELNVHELKRQQRNVGLDAIQAQMNTGLTKGAGGSLFPVIWMLESLSSPLYADQPERQSAAQDARITVLRRIIADKVSAGGEECVESLLWKSMLAFCLIEKDQSAEALALLEASAPAWRRIVPPADPWLEILEVLRASAVIGVHPRAADGRIAPDQRAALAAPAALLRAFVERSTGVDGQGPIMLARRQLTLLEDAPPPEPAPASTESPK